MLCVPPRWETILPDFVAQRAQADAEHFGGMRTISISESQGAFQVQPFHLTDRSARDRRLELRMRRSQRSGATLKFHFEASGIQVERAAQREDAPHKVG